MAFKHGKGTVVKLDDLAGALQDISAFLTDFNYDPKTDRPETQTFGKLGKKHEVTGLREVQMSFTGFLQLVSGTKLHGKTTRILHDAFPLTGFLNKVSLKRDIDTPETQTFGDTWKRHYPGSKGLMSADLSFSGLFDSGAAAVDQAWRASLGVDPPGFTIMDVAANGFAIGNLVEMLQSVQGSYSMKSSENSLVTVDGSFMSDDVFDLGVSLHDLVAETGVPPVNYAGVDWTDVTTTSGWVAHLHISAFTGTNIVIKLQDSADNATFADLAGGTFTSAVGVGAQRLEGAQGATVRRYVRAVAFSGTFTSVTFAVTFSRRGFIAATAGTHKHFCGLLTFGMPLIGAGSLGATTTFEYGPEGSASGSRRLTGECVLTDYSIDTDENGVSKLSGTLTNDGAITENTY